jgi:translocation and assembly module TamB
LADSSAWHFINMTETKTPEKKKRTVAARIVRIIFRIVLIIILLVSLIALSILTPPVQNFIRGKATSWLSGKLKTKVEIGKIYIGFPKNIVLEDVYVEDRQKDTLLYGGKLKADIAMLELLHSEVEVSRIQISDLTAKVSRVLPDTIYNFQFIIDAFASKDTVKSDPTDTSGMKISVKGIELDRIRLLYKDDLTGYDVTFGLDHFDTEFDVFDLDKMRFGIPETNIKGITAKVYQHKPLQHPAVATATGTSSAALPDVSFRKISLSDINLDYGNDVSALYSKIKMGALALDADKVDMVHQTITLNEVSLNNTTASLHMGREQTAKIVETKKDTAVAVVQEGGWRVLVKNVALDNNNIAFDNDNNTPVKKGMDYMHLGITGLTLHAANLQYTPDSMSASITKGSMTEKSGFRLNTLQADFLYAANQAYLHNLLIETPGTTLRRSASISYPSLDALKKNIGQLKMDIDLNQSRIQVKDILTFAPFLATQPALSNPAATWLLDGNIKGSVANMDIRKLQLRAFSNTSLDMHGTIAGLPDAKKLRGNLVINSFRTSRKDIQLLAPKGSLPTSITIPETMNLRGTVSGSMNDAHADLDLTSNLGSASVKGSVSNPTDKQRAKYNATLTARQLDLGKILKNDTMYGPVSATLTAAGTGLDQKTANAKVTGLITSAMLNRYVYKNVKFDGQIANQHAAFAMNVKDPNIAITMNGKADLSKKYPALSVNAMIDSIKTFPLHFTSDSIEYRGNIAADFPNTDMKALQGQLLITGSALVMQGQRYALDTIALTSGKTDTGQFVRLNSDAITFALTGKYNLAQIGSVIQQSIQPYYAISKPAEKPDTLDDYNFYFKAQVINGPLLKVFAPTLTRLDPVTMNGHFVSDEGFQTDLDAPMIIMGANRIQKFKLNAHTSNGAILVRSDLEQFSAGPSMIVYATRVNAKIEDNKINFLVNLKDLNNKNKYRLGGLFEQPQTGIYTLSINRDSILLNYDKWKIASNNLIKLDNGDINISNFSISNNGQVLTLHSTAAERNSPLEVKFENFRIGTITAFAKQDSLPADGTINGNVLVKNIVTQPVFTSDLTVTDLMFQRDTVGNLAIKVNNAVANTYNADIALTGKGNDVHINGDYLVKADNQSAIDLKMDIRALQMSSVQAFSFGSISNASGFIDGKFDIAGTFDKPDVNGNLNFNQAGFSPTLLGSYFTLDQQKINVNNEGISFDNFTIKDSSKNELVLDGNAYTTNFMNYKFDMDLKATNFKALNSTKANSKLFYGQFYFDTDLQISGTEKAPVVDGDLTVTENTKLTVALPEDEPGVVAREGIVNFIDVDSLKTDTLLLLAKDTLSKSDITGMDISVNIEIRKEAELTLVVDQANGDFLRMQGTAQLTGGIDPSGKTTLAGTYEIDKGEYNLSFNFLKRQFAIKQGSKITWLGEPTKANVDLTAVYIANTAPLTLLDQSGTTTDATMKQKLPFEVNLILGGELLKPSVSFDIALPEDKNYNVSSAIVDDVQRSLANLRAESEQLNKQVFALLLLNRFVAENPFASSGGGFNAGTAARQSVSKILSDQLNNLASDLIKGVDLNFDLASNEDYTTGEMENRTDLNVSLSKQLLNDRLKVTVGSNFELEGPQASNQKSNNLAGNVALDYILSKDGRYMVRAYRKNEYEGELDGYIIETGLNFIIRFDYNRFNELFHSPKKKIKQQKKREKNNEPTETDARKAGPVNAPAINQ